jgi:hypothetical protein
MCRTLTRLWDIVASRWVVVTVWSTLRVAGAVWASGKRLIINCGVETAVFCKCWTAQFRFVRFAADEKRLRGQC